MHRLRWGQEGPLSFSPVVALPETTAIMTNADQNLEPGVEAVEIDMQELKRSISVKIDGCHVG